MKKLSLILLLTSLTLLVQAQKYKTHFNKGMELFQTQEFYQAYLQFNAAKVFAKTAGNSKFAKKAETWSTKSTQALNKLLLECRRQQFIEDSIFKAKKHLRESILAELPLSKGVSNAFDYYLPLSDTLFAKGKYKQALKNYQLLLQLSEAQKQQQEINNKISKIPILIEKTSKADNLLYQGKWQEARDLYTYVKQTNATDSICRIKLSIIERIQKGELIFVKGGDFMMGSKDNFVGNEYLHKINLSNYYIAKTEVTNKVYADFLNAYGADTVKTGKYQGQKMIYENGDAGVELENGIWKSAKEKANYPVIDVTWYGANEFCQYYGLALPSEAQWEYAARGGINYKNNFEYAGSNKLSDVAWYRNNSKNKKNKIFRGRGTHAVAGLAPNQLGIYDMSGNVWEWCADWYDNDFYKKETAKNPENLLEAKYRVLRGGSWYYYTVYSRVAYRYWYNPNNRNYFLGFRFVLFVDFGLAH